MASSGVANRAEKRRARKELRDRQVVRGDRSLIDMNAYAEGWEKEAPTDDDVFDLLRDDVLAQLYDHFNKLRAAGADVLQHTVIVIGVNPEWPGNVMVQTQCDVERPGFELSDELEPLGIGEAIEPSDDELDSED